MGLIHPGSIELWREWAGSRDRARRAKHGAVKAINRVRGRAPEQSPTWLRRHRPAEMGHDGPGVLLVMDSGSPSARAAVLSVLPYLRCTVDVLSPERVELPEAAGDAWTAELGTDPRALLAGCDLGAVVTIGHHLHGGAIAHRLALELGIPELVVQHGVLTPFAPPLPEGATLLAWSEADAEFWRSGRSDVDVRAIGSQLLWQAGHETGPVDPDARPVFLGQLHGAELPRRITGGEAYRFCREHGALYRPHPSEQDVLSRAMHGLMQRRGIELADPTVPLKDVGSPVVAVFSTGVLEAAARGVPAWVHGPGTPTWVHELWDRYGMRPFGSGEPTSAAATSIEEPATAIATLLEEYLGVDDPGGQHAPAGATSEEER